MRTQLENPSTVFLLEDESALQTIYRLWLEEEYEVKTAHAGEEALEIIDGGIDFGLFDRRIPEPNGDAILVEIREQGYEFPVVMLSGADPEWETIGLPWHGYLIKPVDQDELMAMSRYLERLATADERVREAFATARKKLIIDTEYPPEERETPAYDRLARRLDELHEVGVEAFSDDGWRAIRNRARLTKP